MSSHQKSHSSKPFIALGLFLLIWWSLPPLFHAFVKTSFSELQAPFNILYSHIKDLQYYIDIQLHSKKELVEACRDLSRLNAYHLIQQQENKSMRMEIESLELLLHLPPHPNFRYEIARVCSRDINSWWQQLTIRKGQNYGIIPGQAVVFAGGVVGKIAKSDATTAVVELVSSPYFRCSAHFENNYTPVSYQGQLNKPFSPPMGAVSHVPTNINASTRLVSSRLGAVFPDGLTIGHLKQLKPEADGLFQSGIVILNKKLIELQEVAVLIPIDQE